VETLDDITPGHFEKFFRHGLAHLIALKKMALGWNEKCAGILLPQKENSKPNRRVTVKSSGQQGCDKVGSGNEDVNPIKKIYARR
jgi:hypothetical protein